MQIYPPGTRIGQYEIASRPMMGGMGVVYFAHDHGNDGRPVALKTFRPELLPDRAARDRFLREGTAWIELGSHPHIVRCYKVEYIDPTAFLVLELISKEQNMPDASLRSWLIPGRPLPLEQALLFALQIARGMQYATEKIPGFVHRDLKPENILVGADKLPNTNTNRLRVTDFGLAAILADPSKIAILPSKDETLAQQRLMTIVGAFVGTPEYASPEQFEMKGLDDRSDQYAFGCILYEMLTGRAPFVHPFQTKEERLLKYRNSHLNETVKSPQSVISTKADDVVAITMTCLQKNPIERYGSWEEVEAVLTHAYQSASGGKDIPQAVENGKQIHDERVQAGWSYNAMGVAYADIGKAQVAVGYFEKELSIARASSNRMGEGAALGNLGLAYLDLGDARRAIGYYEQHLEIACKIGDQRGEGNALGNLGLAYADLGDARRAIGYYEQQVAITREIGDRRGEGAAFGNLGLAYADLGDARHAIEYYEQHLTIAREIGDRRGEGAAFGNLGGAHAALGDARRAIGYFEQALAIAHEICDRRGEGNALGNLGGAHVALGDARRAIGYYEQRIEIAREIGDRRGEGAALNGLGGAHAALGDAQRAISYFEQALAIVHEIGDLSGVASVSGNMANLYMQQGDACRALEYAQKAVRAFSQVGHTPNAQRAQQLVDQLQGGTQRITVQAAIIAFQQAGSLDEMKSALAQHPMLKHNEFIQGIQYNIKEQVPQDLKPAIEQRLSWLKQIIGKRG